MDKKSLMEKVAKEAFERGGFNGVWLYAEKGEIISKGAMGWKDADNEFPVEENSVFQLASVSKQFTATAVMLVVRSGKLGLDDDITEYFPELSAYKGVKVKHLLTHTSGIPDYFEDVDWFMNIWEKEKRVPSNDEIVRFLCETKCKPYFAPGEGIEYSNTGYNLLALLVERRSGVPYEEFLRKNIFEPAGMKNTYCCHLRRDGVPFENYARATVYEDGKCVFDVDSKEDREVIALDGLNGDDYVYTTIFDMLSWDRALRDGKVLTAEEQNLMYTPAKLNGGELAVYDDEENMGYGFGWATVKDEKHGLIVSHSGGMPGVHTWYERFIDEDGVLIMMFNREPYDYRARLGAWEGLRAISRGEEPKKVVSIEDLTVKNADRTRWESFCGKYERPEKGFSVEEIYMDGGELYAKAFDDEGDGLEFRLYPIGENKFGRKNGMIEISFGENAINYIENTYKKL